MARRRSRTRNRDGDRASPDRQHSSQPSHNRPHRIRDEFRNENKTADHIRPRARGSERDRHHSPQKTRDERGLSPQRSAVTKTKRERTTNPSSRIHSLKKLLSHSNNMPMTIRQEKERELAALLLDQEKNKTAQLGRKNLQRYHFIRFIERQKAERVLKRLMHQQATHRVQDETSKQELERQIHETEVDMNYAKYAPLGEKYIALYADDGTRKAKLSRRMPEHSVLNNKEKEDLFNYEDEQSNVLGSAGGVKPPLWYEIEKYMLEGQVKLEALRDGKVSAGSKLDKELTTVPSKKDAASRSVRGPVSEGRPSWLDDNARIDPADLDSEGDENMSDGGFFER